MRHTFTFYDKIFYLIGKELSGELSFTQTGLVFTGINIVCNGAEA